MLNTTLPSLHCPACNASLTLHAERTLPGASKNVFEVSHGSLACQKCEGEYPILAGIAILVEDVEAYLYHHVKGISKLVDDQDIPEKFQEIYQQAKEEWLDSESEHIEEDLESERVTALYLMTHYLKAAEVQSASPLIQDLVNHYWDHGPFSVVDQWISKSAAAASSLKVIELGCGVGGIAAQIKAKESGQLKMYLGFDNSFASIALARHFNLGVPYPSSSVKVPDDLLHGGQSREINIEVPSTFDQTIDFVVSDVEKLPVQKEAWDISIALNAIDMMEEPASLATLQFDLLVKGGQAIQSCPYIWHERIAKSLREMLPKRMDSASAVEWLYEKAGFRIAERSDHIPWLFFKHGRQLEVYSVHAFLASKD